MQVERRLVTLASGSSLYAPIDIPQSINPPYAPRTPYQKSQTGRHPYFAEGKCQGRSQRIAFPLWYVRYTTNTLLGNDHTDSCLLQKRDFRLYSLSRRQHSPSPCQSCVRMCLCGQSSKSYHIDRLCIGICVHRAWLDDG